MEGESLVFLIRKVIVSFHFIISSAVWTLSHSCWNVNFLSFCSLISQHTVGTRLGHINQHTVGMQLGHINQHAVSTQQGHRTLMSVVFSEPRLFHVKKRTSIPQRSSWRQWNLWQGTWAEQTVGPLSPGVGNCHIASRCDLFKSPFLSFKYFYFGLFFFYQFADKRFMFLS